ncbi:CONSTITUTIVE EXPRESSER OF PR GENES 1, CONSTITUTIVE EXPRESSER OF PR GENES 30 [Hibiscus trionum]|uniref:CONSTITUTIVE EXPRESSER OF PR GENES 1, CONSTITUTIVE EXPRESSER OF PR GENES 30 n=1 Tax=Hibiscus trionum TaxID=183268 RepID=A0A9W7GUG6_HIBTR|nr:CONSTITUTIVE EXPRESSER OF PR GENES 1, CONSTITUTIVE EXPRESSER OF PR GENES 30 [Hibiscus trionum]
MLGLSKTRSELPEMLVFDILSKLPVKSLIRFKCVCKHWSSSFQTPLFITQHHHNHLRNNNLNFIFKHSLGDSSPDLCYFNLFPLYTEDGQSFSLKQNIRLPFFDDRWRFPEVYGPCNGIFCVESEDNLALWNPSTRQFKILPQSSVQRPPAADYTEFESVGFGYDSQTYDYKVVRFVSNNYKNDNETKQVDLYSLNGNSWKEISVPEVSALGNSWYDNHVNGIYYWAASGANDVGYSCILSFDMVNERFSTLSLPGFNGGGFLEYELLLLNFNGLLGAVTFSWETILKSIEIWVMSGSWTKLFIIESVPGIDMPLGFWKNGELFFENSDGELVLFDPSTRELKNLGIHTCCKESMSIIAYAESLVTFN